MRKAFITGISGQDGSYLAEFLIERGYEVHGLIRRHSVAENQTMRIEHIRDKVTLHYGDLTDLSSLMMIFSRIKFSEIYNLGAMSNVGISFKEPLYTQDANYIGFINLMEAISMTHDINFVSIYQASSSEMFGNCLDADGFQRETTEMIPVSPYGISKLSAHRYAQHLRRAYGYKIWCGILFNHESERRGTNFVTGKVAKGVAEIVLGKTQSLSLGNLDSSRDWGHSKDYVKVMWQMLHETEPDDFICCTSITNTIKTLCEVAFRHKGLDWTHHVSYDKQYERSEELNFLRGCSDKLQSQINIKFEYTFESMIHEMVDYHIQKLM